MIPTSRRVFLNVPFDRDYEPLLLALVAGLVARGFEPHCVLEIADRGEGRLRRILRLIRSCGASVHDLSRVESGVPRFNMPFELGMAYALSRLERHSFVLLEAERFRLQRSLSDLNGHDPQIHGGRVEGVLAAVASSFAGRRRPTREQVAKVHRGLSSVAERLRREAGAGTVFDHGYMFPRLVGAAFRIVAAQDAAVGGSRGRGTRATRAHGSAARSRVRGGR